MSIFHSSGAPLFKRTNEPLLGEKNSKRPHGWCRTLTMYLLTLCIIASLVLSIRNTIMIEENGTVGPQGIQGEVGPQGPTGATGAQGIQGLQGLQGDAGATGAQGPQGLQGLQGDAGATGAQGPQGLQGDAGATGAQGPQGIQGPTGPTGPQGENGTTTIIYVTGSCVNNNCTDPNACPAFHDQTSCESHLDPDACCNWVS